MRWKDYNNMKKELKDEYDYKFKESPKVGYAHIGFIFLIWAAMIVIMLFTYYLAYTMDDIPLLAKEQISNAILTFNNFTQVFGVIIILMFLYDGICVILYYFRRSKWLKQNNIKVKKVNILPRWW